MLADWNHDNDKITLHQDNINTIFMSHQGHRPYSDKVAMNRRYFNHAELIAKGIVTMPHCDSKLMLSDCLSKARIDKQTTVNQLRQIAGIDDIETKSNLTAIEQEVIAYFCHSIMHRDDETDDISALFTFIELDKATL